MSRSTSSSRPNVTAARHNHPVQPFSPLRPPSECPRCDQRRADRATRGLLDHNHAPLPFGRRLTYGQCPRCDQLHDGAPARPGYTRRARRDEEELHREMQAHFAPDGPHERGVCGPVCTAFDW